MFASGTWAQLKLLRCPWPYIVHENKQSLSLSTWNERTPKIYQTLVAFYIFSFYPTEVPLLSKWEGILTGFIHQNPCKETAYSMLHPTLVVIWTSFVLPPWTVEGQAFLRHSSHSLLLIRIGFWSETLCEVFKFYDLSTFVKISNFSPLSLSSFI